MANSTAPEKKQLALEALLEGKQLGEAADAAGVHQTTVTRWLNHDEDFARAINKERAKRTRALRIQIQLAGQKAITRLLELMDSGDEKIALGAASKVLDLTGVVHLTDDDTVREVIVRLARGASTTTATLDVDAETERTEST